MTVRVIALGNEDAGDDAAAMVAARRLECAGVDGVEVIRAGRPGPGLLELLDPGVATVLLDVIRSGREPGTVVSLPLSALSDASLAGRQLSSHGFGPAESLRLGAALGRPLPPGRFVGIEGSEFSVGTALSAPVAAAMEGYMAAVRAVVDEVSGGE